MALNGEREYQQAERKKRRKQRERWEEEERRCETRLKLSNRETRLLSDRR